MNSEQESYDLNEREQALDMLTDYIVQQPKP